METISITEALRLAIAALNHIPNSGLPDNAKGERMNTYKLIPQLEEALKVHGASLERIAKGSLWGEPVEDDALRAELIEAHEYDLEDNSHNPSADSESSYLREAVETVRGVLGLPFSKEA